MLISHVLSFHVVRLFRRFSISIRDLFQDSWYNETVRSDDLSIWNRLGCVFVCSHGGLSLSRGRHRRVIKHACSHFNFPSKGNFNFFQLTAWTEAGIDYSFMLNMFFMLFASIFWLLLFLRVAARSWNSCLWGGFCDVLSTSFSTTYSHLAEQRRTVKHERLKIQLRKTLKKLGGEIKKIVKFKSPRGAFSDSRSTCWSLFIRKYFSWWFLKRLFQ